MPTMLLEGLVGTGFQEEFTEVSDASNRPKTLAQLRAQGWVSRTVKDELRENFLRALQTKEDLFPGVLGYTDTVIPEISLAVLAGHDMLFLGEKGQAKSRLMRLLGRFLDDELPYLDLPGCPVHEDPYKPITSGRPRSACRPARGPGADRLVAAEAALRRAPRSGDQVRRHHRRD